MRCDTARRANVHRVDRAPFERRCQRTGSVERRLPAASLMPGVRERARTLTNASDHRHATRPRPQYPHMCWSDTLPAVEHVRIWQLTSASPQVTSTVP